MKSYKKSKGVKRFKRERKTKSFKPMKQFLFDRFGKHASTVFFK